MTGVQTCALPISFIVASLVIVIVSLITEAPSEEIIAEFEQVDRDLSD